MNHLKLKLLNFLSGTPIIFLYSVITFFIASPEVLKAQNFSPSDQCDVLLLKEDYKGASNCIESLITKDTGDAMLYYKLGLAYQKQYLFRKAANIYSKSIALNGNLIASLINLAACYSELGENKNALPLYKMAFSKNSSNITVGLNLASVLVDMQYYDSAKSVYNKLLKLDSTNSYIYRQLGFCSQNTDTGVAPMRYYNIALHYDKYDFVSIQHLVNLYLKKHWDKAIFQLLNKYIDKNPEDPLLNKLMGEAYFDTRQYKMAAASYDKTVAFGDSSAYIYQKLGISLYFCGDNEDSLNLALKDSCFNLSITALNKSFAKEYNPVISYFLAEAYQKIGNYKMSINYYNKTLDKVLPGFLSDLYIHLSECYLAIGDYTNAADAYKGAFFFNQDNNSLLLNIGELYEKKLVDNKSAIRYYEEYIDNDTLKNELSGRVKQTIKLLKMKKE